MDLTIDLGVIVQTFMAASFVWFGKQVRDVVIMIKLHEWRINQQDKRLDSLESVHKVSILTTNNELKQPVTAG